MQQIAAGSKFWWRAQDASTLPDPLLDPAPDLHFAAPLVDLTPQSPAASQAYALRVPRSDVRRRTRRSSRRSRRLASSIAVVATMTAGAAAALTSPGVDPRLVAETLSERAATTALALGLGIDQVSMAGHSRTTDSDVFDALDLSHVRGFWQLDANAALKRIERISWVDKAQITRTYPGRLHIEIRERTPVAVWRRGESDYLVDATGRVLGRTGLNERWALPRISGEGANSEATVLLKALERHHDIAQRVVMSERVAERRWRLILDNGSRIELGAEREVEGLDQIARSTSLKSALLGAKPSIVDVRTQGRIAVRSATDKLASASAGAP